jgi:Esterase PHB depolymerase
MWLIFLTIAYQGESLTTSGISSGGFFSTQFHVAYSSKVTGAGVIAGGPYLCSQGSLAIAETACLLQSYLIDMQLIYSEAEKASDQGLIDNLNNLTSAKVWIFSGLLDTTVNQGVVRQTQKFYENYIISGTILTNYNTFAEHSWVTNGYGNLCSYLGLPYINNCGVDAAGNMLKLFYGNLKARVSPVSSNLYSFKQSDYGNIVTASMYSLGFIYVPNYCLTSQCPVHISFHGCLQSAETLGKTFVTYSGLNDWAESNNIIILYPQAATSASNPQGCWDFWGYTGQDYAYKSGKQMALVYSITQKLPIVSWN